MNSKLRQNVSLAAFNTLKSAVKSRFFTSVSCQQELQQALQFTEHEQLPLLVLGGGSNVVLTEDFPGLCIQIDFLGIAVSEIDDDWMMVEVQAGEPWHPFVEYCLENNLYGLENLALIPGTVGASPIQNVGAYGVEVKDFLWDLCALDRATKQVRCFSNADCRFGYRDSVFKQAYRDRYIITSVRFRLRRRPSLQTSYAPLSQLLDHNSSARDLFDSVVKVRSAKLPDPGALANVGSFFKNPVVSTERYQRLQKDFPGIVGFSSNDRVKLAAGWLIDQAGWKGFRRDGVGVHEHQALVLVNYGTGTASEVLALAADIQADIQSRYGVTLEIEPRVY